MAVVLWGVFWLGDKASAWLFDFARPQVELIYGMKTGENPWLLSILLLILIGPAEEIFWRGYVQNALSKRWSPNVGFIVTTLVYALVHRARGSHALGNGTRHRLRIARTAPINNSSFHVCKFLSFNDFI